MNIELRIPSPRDLNEAPHRTRGPLSRPSMMQVGRDDFILELAAETGVQAQLIRVVVRAFLAAALRGGDALTPEGWRSVVQDMRYVLGSALSEGVERVRPVNPRKKPDHPVPVERREPPRAPVAHDPLIPIFPAPRDNEPEVVFRQGLPVRFIHALVRAYVAARMRGEEGTTPEGRSRILCESRELVWDGILDAVKQVPCPSAPPPRESPRPPRQSQPEQGR